MNELNYKGPDLSLRIFSQETGTALSEWSHFVEWIKKLFYKLLDFGWRGRKEGNKREILTDLVNMDMAGARKTTLEKWLMALIMVSILRTLASTVAAKCSSLFLHFLSGTACAYFSKKGCSQITIELWAYWFYCWSVGTVKFFCQRPIFTGVQHTHTEDPDDNTYLPIFAF